jgi:glycogen debranching enzyme
MYDYCKKGVLGWLLNEMDSDKDLLADGYGIIEIYCLNLEMLDTAVLTYEALEGLLNMAKALDDVEIVKKCEGLIPKIKEEIENKFWMEEEGLYADMSGSIKDMRSRAVHLINNEKMDTYKKKEMEHYFNLNRDEDEEKDLPWLMKNWIVVSPLEAKLANAKRAKRVFERLESSEFTNEYGLQLNGVKNNENIGSNEKSDDIYALDLSMSISSGVMAYAESLYKRADESFKYTKKLAELLYCCMPGAISENLPDKGCFLQSWSSYGVNWTIISGIVGINPDVTKKTIIIKPTLPKELDYIEIKKMLIGEFYFDINIKREGKDIKVEVKDRHGFDIKINN